MAKKIKIFKKDGSPTPFFWSDKDGGDSTWSETSTTSVIAIDIEHAYPRGRPPVDPCSARARVARAPADQWSYLDRYRSGELPAVGLLRNWSHAQ